jgi:hypothetical protein
VSGINAQDILERFQIADCRFQIEKLGNQSPLTLPLSPWGRGIREGVIGNWDLGFVWNLGFQIGHSTYFCFSTAKNETKVLGPFDFLFWYPFSGSIDQIDDCPEVASLSKGGGDPGVL